MHESSVIFLSDAHLGAESPEREGAREARLHDFLASLPGRASSLVIVGDLFDFWFEYRTAIPRRLFGTLAALQRLRSAGVDVAYLNGNHDFWLGSFLHETLGIRTTGCPLVVEQQGRRIWVHHGDGLIGGDAGYKLLRGILRSPLSVRLYQLLHPDLGIPLALWVSKLSRRSREHQQLQFDRLWNEVAAPRFAAGFDAVVIGHFHEPHEDRREGREFFMLGDWIEHFSYLELRSGRLELKTWGEPG